jgi:hypothetical protein
VEQDPCALLSEGGFDGGRFDSRTVRLRVKLRFAVVQFALDSIKTASRHLALAGRMPAEKLAASVVAGESSGVPVAVIPACSASMAKGTAGCEVTLEITS